MVTDSGDLFFPIDFQIQMLEVGGVLPFSIVIFLAFGTLPPRGGSGPTEPVANKVISAHLLGR